MPDPLSFDRWAFTWYQHTCGSTATNPVVINPVLYPPRYSNDFKKITEITYDEYAQYCFHFRVIRNNQYISPFIMAEMLLEKKLLFHESGPVYLSNSFEAIHEKVNPNEPEQPFNPTNDNENIFTVKLFWPRRWPEWHSPGLYTFRVTLGWKGQFDSRPTWSAESLPLIQIKVTDIIPK